MSIKTLMPRSQVAVCLVLLSVVTLTACDKKAATPAPATPVDNATVNTAPPAASTPTLQKQTVAPTAVTPSITATANTKTALSEPARTADLITVTAQSDRIQSDSAQTNSAQTSATSALTATPKDINPKHPDTHGLGIHLITQPTKAGTPEDTLKKATDALMNGTAKQAASYYHVDMAGFDKVLAQQQPTLQQQLKHLEIVDTEYQPDKTKAIIMGKMTTTDSSTPKEVGYKLQKIDGQWKLVP